MGSRVKLVSALVLAFALVVGIAACGGGNEDDSTSGGSGGTAKPSEVSGTVTVWDTEYQALPEYTEAIDQIDSEFERAYPGVTVDRVGQPYEGYEATYRAAFAGQQGPDIMSFPQALLSFSKGLEKLNDRISPELQEQLTVWENVTAGYTPEGEHYGVPIGLNGWAFYYNKKLFQKAGLPREFEPSTWAEVREAGEKLEAAGITGFTGGGKEGLQNPEWFGIGFETENSASEASELANGELAYTDEAAEKAFAPLVELHEAGLFPDDFFSTPVYPEGWGRFSEGKGAMVLGFWNAIGFWGEFNPALGEKNVGVFFPPGNNGPVGAIGSILVGIPKFADNKDAAWALIEFMVSKGAMETLVNVGNFMPNRKDVSLPASAAIQAQEIFDISRDRGTTISPYATVPSVLTNESMPTEINEVLQGRQSLSSALQNIQEEAERTGE